MFDWNAERVLDDQDCNVKNIISYDNESESFDFS